MRRPEALIRFVAAAGLLLVSTVAPAVVELEDVGESLALGPQVLQLEDRAGTMTLEQAVENSDAFSPAARDSIAQGYTPSAWWYLIDLHGPQAPPNSVWVLEAGFPPLDFVDFYVLREQHPPVRHVAAGDHRPQPAQLLLHHNYALPIQIGAGERMSILLRVQTGGTHRLPLRLSSGAAFQARAGIDSFWLGAYYGIVLVMALYNFFIWFTVRDRIYLYYLGFLVSIALFQLSLSGYLRLLPEGWPGDGLRALSREVPLLTMLPIPFSLLFARGLLNVGQHLPRIDRAVGVLIIAMAVAMPLVLLLPDWLGSAVSAGLAAAMCLFLIAQGVTLLLRGVRAARLFLIAWTALLLGVIAKVLEATGAVPSHFLTFYGWQIGSALDVTLLSLALAERINTERQQKLEAQKEAMQVREEATEARDRLYADLHDDIGSTLTTLVHSLEQPVHGDLARSALQDLRDIVSRSSGAAGSLLEVLACIRDESEQRLDLMKASLQWDQDPALPDPALNEKQALHLFRIMREALTNAVRHGHAHCVRVRLQAVAGELVLVVSDDGEGLSEKPVVEGRGTSSMRSRAADLHGSIEWGKATDGGTRVLLRFPLPS